MRWKRDLAGMQSRLPERTLDIFTENPFWTIRGLAERLGVAYTTAQRTIDRLESVGLVAQVGDVRRNRVYCAEQMLDVWEAPARLDS